MLGVRRRGHGHFLLDPGGDENQHRYDQIGRVRLGQVQPQEAGVKGNDFIYPGRRNPGVELLGKTHQFVGVGEQGLHQHPEQPQQNWHLNNHRPQAADGAYAGILVSLHGFLGNAGPVPGVARLDLTDPGLETAHGPHLFDLPNRKREGNYPYQDGKQQDGDAHVAETDHVQHDQRVEHRPDYELGPDEIKGFQ